jgi:acetoin utilization deacetylase AcuC-like enzyme
MPLLTAFVTHHDCSRHDTGWQHPEHQGRLPGVARAVYREMLSLHEVLREVEGVPATEETLLLAHDARYLDRVRDAVASAAQAGAPVDFENGTRLSAASWDALTAAAGCVVTAVETVLAGEVENAFCAIRPPGSGAGRSSAGAHAIVNNVGIGARHLRENRGAGSVLILEWGERFGSGTAEIAAADPGLRYLSIHAGSPAEERSEGRIRSAGLPAGAGADAILEMLDRTIPDLLDGTAPAMILLSLGLDVLESDPLGTLGVRPADLYPLTRRVVEIAAGLCGGRLVTALEGGFDPRASGQAVVHHLRALAGLPPG